MPGKGFYSTAMTEKELSEWSAGARDVLPLAAGVAMYGLAYGLLTAQAALDLANSGYYVYLLEKSPSIGGVMSQLDKTFPTNDCAM